MWGSFRSKIRQRYSRQPAKQFTVQSFLDSLHLGSYGPVGDYDVLRDHMTSRGGADLSDPFTEGHRRFLRRHPPLGLSWNGEMKLEDGLREADEGLAPRDAYQIGLPAIGIVAVLVANVTFLGWATPPGGSTPYWQSCNYPIFTAFLILNSASFMLALATVAVVTAFPLFLSKKPRHAAVLGGMLLCWCLLAFIVAFILAGFVAVGYGAPAPDCAIVRCNAGGIACTVTVGHDAYIADDIATFGLPEDNYYYILDNNVAALNNMVSSSGYDPLLCLPYLYSTYDGNVSSPTLGLTLYPEFPQRLPSLRPVDDRLLRDAYYQRSVLCGQRQNFVYIYGSNKTPGWSVSAITGLNGTLYDYVNPSTTTTVADLIADRNLGLVAYSSLRFGCFGTSNPLGNTLCDLTQPDSGLSVSATGGYITEASVASFGGQVFKIRASGSSDQVVASLWAVTGLFCVAVLSVTLYLWKHK